MNATSQNPYIGPRTFQRDEGHLFFGRDREARDLIALVASERLVVFYVTEHNGHIPHSAFRGETPDEMYYGCGADIAEQLAIAKERARTDRITANRARTCQLCQDDTGNEDLAPMMA